MTRSNPVSERTQRAAARGDVDDRRRQLQRHRRLADDRLRVGLDGVDGLDLDDEQARRTAVEGGDDRAAAEPQLDVVAALHPVPGRGRRRRRRGSSTPMTSASGAADRVGGRDAEPRRDVGRRDGDHEVRLGDREQHAVGLDRPRDVDRLGRAVVEVDRGRPRRRHSSPAAVTNVVNTAAAVAAARSTSAGAVSSARGRGAELRPTQGHVRTVRLEERPRRPWTERRATCDEISAPPSVAPSVTYSAPIAAGPPRDRGDLAGGGERSAERGQVGAQRRHLATPGEVQRCGARRPRRQRVPAARRCPPSSRARRRSARRRGRATAGRGGPRAPRGRPPFAVAG